MARFVATGGDGTPPRTPTRMAAAVPTSYMSSPKHRFHLLDLSDQEEWTIEPLRRIFLRFSSFGRGHRVNIDELKMDGRTFVKFARDTGLLSKRSLPQSSVDLIFAKIRRKGSRTIGFEQFLVALRHVAAHRGVAHQKLIQFVLKQHDLMADAGSEALPFASSQLRAAVPPNPHTALSSSPGRRTRTTTSGLVSTPRCALIVIDMQLDFYSRNPAVSSAFPNLPQRMSSLIEMCRVNAPSVEVVHLREGSNAKESPWYDFWQRLNPGRDSSADPSLPEPCAKDIEGERVFVKLGYDGVGVDSGLVPYLRSRNVKSVLVCGLVTSCCVHMNAAGLFLRGYQTFCVEDACGDRTQSMHRESLEREARRSYGVCQTKDVALYLRALSNASTDTAGDPEQVLIDACWPNKTQSEK